jgi:cell wall-associated NlpC family hydrolase
MTPSQRAAIVAEAESWLRTPYHSNAAVKGSGADCGLFPLDVYTRVLGFKAPPLPKYVQQWNLHRNDETYLEYARAFPNIIEISEAQLQPGDFALWRIGRVYSHGAIVTAWPKIIHAFNPRGVIRDDASIEPLLNRTDITRPLFFTF